jgi:hypothetical protein
MSLVGDTDFWRHREKGLAVFVAPGVARIHKLPLPVPETALLGVHFHIRLLLPILDDAGPFWLLTISARRTRLYRGSRWRFAETEDVDLPQDVERVARITEYQETHSAARTGRRSAETG